MKYLALIIIFLFPMQLNAEEVWKPFGFELGGKFIPNPNNIINMARNCDGYDRCYLIKTKNKTFKEIEITTNENKETQLIGIRQGMNRQGEWIMTQPECSDLLKDLRDIAVNKYNFKAISSGDNKNINTKPDGDRSLYLYKSWDGEKNNMKLDILCIGWYSVDKAELSVKWYETRTSLDTDL